MRLRPVLMTALATSTGLLPMAFKLESGSEAYAPLANLFDYIDAVRSLSQGRASTSMEPHAYKEAPPDVLHRLLNPTDYY